MNDTLPPVSRDNIPTLLDQKRGKLVIVAFCPICDRTAQAPDDGQSREHAAATATAKIKVHLEKAHPLNPRQSKSSQRISVRTMVVPKNLERPMNCPTPFPDEF